LPNILNAKVCLQADKFHEYVRPVLHPTLSKFCTKLTGITQVHAFIFSSDCLKNVIIAVAVGVFYAVAFIIVKVVN